MKRNQIMLGAVFSVFLVLSTPVLANILLKENQILSNSVIKKDTIDQKELLFQTILDIGDNREIQRLLLNSEMRRGTEKFCNPDTKFSVFTPHVLTKAELNTAYHIGLIVSKNFDVSRIHSMFERYRGSNQGLQKEITDVIEKDATLNGEFTQLSNSTCDCEDKSGVTSWPFPVICTILGIILFFDFFLVLYLHIGNDLAITLDILLEKFNCPWTP